jgi:hypothetical protein
MTRLTLSLPDDLAQQAKDAGLLDDKSVERLLRRALNAHQRISAVLAKLDAVGEPPMTDAEVAREVARARQRLGDVMTELIEKYCLAQGDANVAETLNLFLLGQYGNAEDFLDFLLSRDHEHERAITRAAQASSERALAALWSNDADAVYDRV